MNEVFLTDVRLEGIYIRPGSNDASIVTSQEWINAADENNPYPSENEIVHFMKDLGFVLFEGGLTKWHRQVGELRVVVADTRIHNFIKSAAGVIPVDLLVNKHVMRD